MVSIIIPIYNSAQSLPRCLDSVCVQYYGNYEIILINDGSTDGSDRICDEYAAMNSNIRVFHKANSGVSAARNLGIDKAHGEWITFCDSDDYVDDCWLQYFTDYINDDVDLVVQQIKLKNRNYEEIQGPNKLSEGNGCDIMISLKYDSGTIGYPVNKLFRTSILRENNIKFREDIKLREDEEFVLRYLMNIRKGVIVNKVGYNYLLPDYKRKYSNIDVFDTIIILYNSSKQLSSGKRNSAVNAYQVELTNHLIASLYAGKYHYVIPFIKAVKLDLFRYVSIKAIVNKVISFIRK
jgi:glycosyltransferase involved in cell wall biosynthesis